MRYLLPDAALALRPTWKSIFVTSLLLLLPWPLPAASLRITAPDDLTAPDPASIQVTGAPPKSTVRIETIRRVSEEWSFVGAAQFIADLDGRVDTQTAKPDSGTYSGRMHLDSAGESTELLVFPGAEHALGGPGTVPMEWVGGDKIASIRARTEAWAVTFEMFGRMLHP